MLRQQLVGGQNANKIATVDGDRDPHVEKLGVLDNDTVKAQKVKPVQSLQRVTSGVCQCSTKSPKTMEPHK